MCIGAKNYLTNYLHDHKARGDSKKRKHSDPTRSKPKIQCDQKRTEQNRIYDRTEPERSILPHCLVFGFSLCFSGVNTCFSLSRKEWRFDLVVPNFEDRKLAPLGLVGESDLEDGKACFFGVVGGDEEVPTLSLVSLVPSALC